MSEAFDAVVIGSGPNGMVAANLLQDAGWSTLVLEAADTPGGAVRSDQLTLPGFVHDTFSSFYPLAKASPVIERLRLERFGLRWAHAPLPVAHAFRRGPAAIVHPRVEDTAKGLDADHGDDGEAWEALVRGWNRHRSWVIDAMFTPFPPVRAGMRMLRRQPDVRESLRFALLPVRHLADERFRTEAAKLLLYGNAFHADLSPESAGSGIYGTLMTMLAQDVGFPVPVGGAASLIHALRDRFLAAGGELRCARRVGSVRVEHGRAVGVETFDGEVVRARHGVLADVDARSLVCELLGDVPAMRRWRAQADRFQYDYATVKVDWAVRGDVPWHDARLQRAATVHIGDSTAVLSRFASDVASGRIPQEPFAVVGQPSVADASRAPAGHHTVWAYTHIPMCAHRTEADVLAVAERLEQTIEAHAPGFSSQVLGRHVIGPGYMHSRDANLVGGGLGGGTNQVHQQLVMRPFTSWGRPTTPVRNLYLASASAHPGGGVHGAPGSNAARAALAHHRLHRR